MFADRPVSFETIDYEPGFPSLSVADCNAWMFPGRFPACTQGPTIVGREGMPPAAVGLGELDFAGLFADPLGWARANTVPLMVGAAIGLLLGGMRR